MNRRSYPNLPQADPIDFGSLSSRHLPLHRLLLVIVAVIVVTLFAAHPAKAQDTGLPASSAGAVVSVHFKDQSDANRLAGKYDVWAVDHKTHIITAYLTNAQIQDVQAAGYQVEIDTARMSSLQATMVDAASADTVPGFPCYRTVEETYNALKKLATDHPTLARWVDIGDSWLKTQGSGGYNLYALVLTNRAVSGPKPRFFLMAAIHAREMTTAEVATRFAESLISRYGSDPDVTWLLDYTEIHIVAQSNPDGRKRAEGATNPSDLVTNWRKNVDNLDLCPDPSLIGVDLNRNSSFKWGQSESGTGSSSYSCDLTYRGRSAASEPETRALEAYIKSIFADQRGPNDTDSAPVSTTGIMISLHSFSQKILFPWGWTATPSPNDQWLRTLGRKFGYFTGYEACQSGEDNCIYQTDGTTDDFAYGELGIAAYTFELGTTFYESCPFFEDYTLDRNLDALMYAAKSSRAPYQTPAGPDVISATTVPTMVVAGPKITLTVTADASRYAANNPLFGEQTIHNIRAVSYTVDLPPWTPGVVAKPLKGVGAFDSPIEQAKATLDTTGWARGRHIIFVTAEDVAGNRGAPTAVFIDIPIKTYMPLVSKNK
jgi:carboxypeptidase T